MSPRINISIPHDLHSKLQKMKEKINISKSCQEAIARAIELEELKLDKDIEKTTSRIMEEIKKGLKPFYNEGFQDGQRAAHSIDLYGFDYFRFEQDFVTNPASMLDEVGDRKSFDKYESLGGNDSVLNKEGFEIDLDIFFDMVEGDLVGKGFCCQGTDIPKKDWGPGAPFLSWSYFDGWYQGFQFVIRQVEERIKEITYDSFKAR